ncbi:YeeE/YedE family lipoprotein [Candidatus Vecturithrix granuli]|uniref:YeeE/YedE family lipoprotein n=1 Tax=Vecturithrix granuli TaxID=1499967 RepID=A0A081BW21_VECG1|nr:YeeE/YedE family lipoprotein [Candidatus Vecturithrix granuli]
MSWFTMETWPPYVVGIGIGILSWFTFLLSDKPLGCSTTFARLSGMIEKYFRGREVEEKAYYKEIPPVIDWQFMLVIGIVIGAFLSSILSGTFQFVLTPSLWVERFGPGSGLSRFIVSLLGGILMGIGSRWADGCTSGHGVSGTLQMAIGSWVSVACFFIAGIVTAVIIYP